MKFLLVLFSLLLLKLILELFALSETTNEAIVGFEKVVLLMKEEFNIFFTSSSYLAQKNFRKQIDGDLCFLIKRRSSRKYWMRYKNNIYLVLCILI